MNGAIKAAAGAALLVLATARLSRLVTSDKLGDWAVVQPAKRWAQRNEPHAWAVGAEGEPLEALSGEVEEAAVREAFPDRPTWRTKLVQGLECPFCIGFWLGSAALATRLLPKRSPLRKAADAAGAALALNYAAGHLSARID